METITCYDGPAKQNYLYDITVDQYTCDVFPSCDCPTIKGDPDIAGLGVIISFIISAFLTLISTIACLALSRSNENDTYNWVDRIVRGRIFEPFQAFFEKHVGDPRLIADCLYDVVMALSDQQLVVGIAILIAGIKKLYDSPNGSISVYHFDTVSNLAWMSSNTHLLSLSVVRSYEYSIKHVSRCSADDPKQTGWFRLPFRIRIVLMISLATLLLYTCAVTGYADWDDVGSCPASCTIPYAKGGVPLQWMVANYVMVLYGYGIALFNLSRDLRLYWARNIRSKLLGSPGEDLKFSKHPFKVTRCWVIYTLMSESAAILELCVWFGLGVWWIKLDRDWSVILVDYGYMSAEEQQSEDNFGFGQLVPLILLLLPCLQFIESYSWKRHDKERKSKFVHKLNDIRAKLQ